MQSCSAPAAAAPAAEPAIPAGFPLLLDGALVELLDLRPDEDGRWRATVRPANAPHATARQVLVDGLALAHAARRAA